MEKAKAYYRTRFEPAVIKQARTVFEGAVPPGYTLSRQELEVSTGAVVWRHTNDDEFFADYRTADAFVYSKFMGRDYDSEFAALAKATQSLQDRTLTLDDAKARVPPPPRFGDVTPYFQLSMKDSWTWVQVSLEVRSSIEAVFEVFEDNSERSRVPRGDGETQSQMKIFIGHGRSLAWRELKDHLQDKHEYPIVAYEVGARAGHTIRDILEGMLDESTVAVLVLTAEDCDRDGRMHARENVIHETGLFQGRLGFSRTIIVLEQGTEEFSNIHGIQQIRFNAGNIKETFGEILASLRREEALISRNGARPGVRGSSIDATPSRHR